MTHEETFQRFQQSLESSRQRRAATQQRQYRRRMLVLNGLIALTIILVVWSLMILLPAALG